jgi:Ca2+-binding RTX toxin-like protein
MSISDIEKNGSVTESEIVVHGAVSLVGAKAGGRVTSGFDPYAYLAFNPDLYAAFGADVAKAISHYVNFGAAEGRPADGFDAWSYLAFNPDLYNAVGANLGAAVAHYIQSGANEERPLLGFNPYAYLALNPDLFAAFGADPAKALEHYVRSGSSEDRLISGFDPYAYLAMNADLYGAFGMNISAAISHYINNGAAEGRSATGFDAYAYLAQNGDLFAAFGADPAKAVQHYVQSGSREGNRVAGAPPVSATTPPTLSIAATSADKKEGGSGSTAFTFTVTRSGDTSGTSSASWAVSGGSANGADFTGGAYPSGSVSFAKGETSKTITINVAGDTIVESDDSFTVTLKNPSGATLKTTSATGVIRNDDVAAPVLSIAATNAVQTEGNSGTKAFTFTVTRTGDLSKASTVSWAATGSGTNAAAGADFSGATSGRLTFAANERSKTISVNVVGDTAYEQDETFTVTLSGPTNATIGTSGATGTIRNDDSAPQPPTLSIAATGASKAEGKSGTTPFTFTVTRTGDTSVSTSVNWAVSGSAVNAADFTDGRLPSGAITFVKGETSKAITVNVKGDTTYESNEPFTVTLSSPSGTARLGTAAATGTILNDDAAPPPPPPVISITTTSVSKSEGNSGTTPFTFTVTRTGDLSKVSSVSWAAAGSGTNKASATDFSTAPSGRITFAANETTKTITVNVAGDTAIESDETFTVTLSGASGATLGTANAVGTIKNDDFISVSLSGPDIVDEKSVKAVYRVFLSRSPTSSVSVDFKTANGTATAGGDYMPVFKTLTFNTGDSLVKEVYVDIIDDKIEDSKETFNVSISNPRNAILGMATSLTTKILNSESAQIVGVSPSGGGIVDSSTNITIEYSRDISFSELSSVTAPKKIVIINRTKSGGREILINQENINNGSIAISGKKLIIAPSVLNNLSEGCVFGIKVEEAAIIDKETGAAALGTNGQDFKFITKGMRPNIGPFLLNSLPVTGDHVVTQGYNTTFSHGPDAQPNYRSSDSKWAIDFSNKGSALSIGTGKVVFSGVIVNDGSSDPNKAGLGNVVTVKYTVNGRHFYASYAHLAEMKVKKDDDVYDGTLIGTIGDTGKQASVHLHIQFGTDTKTEYVMNPITKKQERTYELADGKNDIIPPVYFSDLISSEDDVPGNVIDGSYVGVNDIIGTPTIIESKDPTFWPPDRLHGNDVVFGNNKFSVNQRIFGLSGYDDLRGNDGDDELFGGQGNDTLSGGAGDDLLVGGLGNDKMTGGIGANSFKFLRSTDGVDVITDFDADTGDRILVLNSAFGITSPSNGVIAPLNQDLLWLDDGKNKKGKSADTRFVFKTTDNTLYYDPDGTGAQTATALAKLTNGATLTAPNIFVVNA